MGQRERERERVACEPLRHWINTLCKIDFKEFLRRTIRTCQEQVSSTDPLASHCTNLLGGPTKVKPTYIFVSKI